MDRTPSVATLPTGGYFINKNNKKFILKQVQKFIYKRIKTDKIISLNYFQHTLFFINVTKINKLNKNICFVLYFNEILDKMIWTTDYGYSAASGPGRYVKPPTLPTLSQYVLCFHFIIISMYIFISCNFNSNITNSYF